MVCNADTRNYTGLGKKVPRPVDVAAARVDLHQSARSRGYKHSREEADPKSLWWCVSLSACSVSCVSIGPPLDVALASPFIVPKGRARVTIVVKR
jgi:hypothetical protein